MYKVKVPLKIWISTLNGGKSEVEKVEKIQHIGYWLMMYINKSKYLQRV